MRTNGKMKRLLAMVMAVVVCFTLVSQTAPAVKGDTADFTAGTYVISTGGKAATAIPETHTYDYMPGTDVTVAEGVVTGYGATNAFTFTASASGFTIQDSYGRYLIGSEGSYKTFTVSATLPETGADWTVTAQADGTYRITNAAMGKTMAYDTEYYSYGAYATIGEKQVTNLTLTTYVAPAPGSTTATLVTDASTLAVGDRIVIASSDGSIAMSTNQKSNNRGATEVTPNEDGTVITLSEDTQVLTLENGTVANTWAFFTGSGYLYAAGQSKANGASKNNNYLKTQTTLDANGSWTVEIEEGVATVTAQGDNGCNWMRYNATSNLFSCYTSGQDDISLYKLTPSVPERTSGIVTDLATLKDGDRVVVFNPVALKAVSTTYNGFYNQGSNVTLADGVLTYEATDVWTLGINADGTYSFSTDGGKLSMGDSYTSTPLGEVNDAWTLTVADASDATYYIANAGRTGYTLQINSNDTWNAYTSNTTGEAFRQQLYLVPDGKTGGEGGSGETPVAVDYTLAGSIAAGDTVVMYNDASGTMLSSTASSYKLSGVAATPADDVISTADTTVAWTVGVDAEGNYTFTQGEMVLGMVSNDTHVNLSTNASDGYTSWTLESSETEKVFYVKNTNIPASSYGPYYLEYYNGYTAYASKSPSDSQYGISFYKIPGGETPASGIADGNYVIWNPTYKRTVANSFNPSNYMLGHSITPVGDTITGYGAVDIWTVTNNADGTITITQDGKYFGNNAGGYIVVDTEVAHPNWRVVPLDDGTVYLSNVGSGKDLEWYASKSDWSMYYYKETDRALYALRFTPVSMVYATDGEVVKDIAQWGGGGPYDDTDNATQVNGDRYVPGDQKDDQAVFTVVANGAQGKPFQTTSSSTGSTNYYMGGTNIGKAAGDYMQFAVNTAGWADMTLAFRLRATAAAPGSFQLRYSTDNGTTWKDFNTGSYAYSYTTHPSGVATPVTGSGSISDGVAKTSLAPTYYVSFSFDVPNGADNCPNLLIRLVAGNERADGDSAKSISGNIRVDSVVLSGSPILDKSVTTYVTVDPNGEDDQPVGTALTMTSEDGAEIWYRVSGGEWKLYSDSAKPTLESLPCYVEAYAKAEGKGTSATMLYSYAAGTVSSVKMDPNGGGVYIAEGGNRVITMTCSTEGATIYYKVTTDKNAWPEEWTIYTGEATDLTLEKGFFTFYVKAYAAKAGFKDSNVITRTFTERNTDSYNLYFGQLHSHTNISDGAGSIDEAYSYAKDTADHIDFLAVTDHSNSFDNTGSGVLAEDASLVSEEWKTAKETAQDFTDENFVGIYGYEMTWSNGLGHINTYNTPGFQSRTQSDYSTYSTALLNYYNTLTTVGDSISQFNHPGTTFGDFQDFAYYTEAYDELITLIEVGNGEGAVGSSGYFPSYEYYTRALDKGWHVAPTNNQDNHKGLWGNANTGRSVVLADSLTEEGIYDAMRNYRVYATEDNDLQIYYTLNDNVMGSILDLDSGDMLTLQLNLHDPTDSNIGKVEVIVNGGLSIASQYVPGHAEYAQFKIPNEYSYYYIRVTQDDGDIAVTAPVWTGEVEAVGISSFTTDAAVAVQNQEMNLTLEMYNNEQVPLELQSVVFQLGDGEDATVIHTADPAKINKVGKLSTASYSFPYTHTGVGNVNIYAVVTATLKGVEKVYKEKLELNFVPREMVTHVIVDGTHYNDYVTGYYGGNINNLTAIAAENSIEVNVVTDQITAEMLKDCQLLIISAPAKKAGSANAGAYVAKPFEDEFLQLVKDYVDAGGSVIVCGLADYQDKGAASADLHTAAQINKLLEAIGSTMRVNDDEVYDEVNNGGLPYRLYPENFNMESRWCEGLVESQTYSQYSGCTVDVGNGTWLVRGFDTTYSIDSDDDKLGGVGEGEAVMLAVEETGKGGNIFVAGGVFVSDFEVKAELDNIWDLPYANRTIIENIMGAVRVELPLSTIAQMRQGSLGEVFRIRGYVTAGTDNEFNTFFDAIYVQDETGGTTVFPFSLSGVALGTPIEILGYVDEYQGDKEIQVMSYTILNDEPNVIAPEKMSNKDAMDYSTNGGELIQVEGEVVEVTASGESGVSRFVVKDEKGDLATVFIDGYIFSGTTGKNELAADVKVGNIVSAVGLLYMHPEGQSEVSVPVLRVRNCDEIKLVKAGSGEIENPTEPTEPTDPSESTKPENPSKPGTDGSSQTGDTVILTVVTIMTISLVGIVALAVLTKKNKRA